MENDQISPERVEAEFDEVIEQADELHRLKAAEAELAGFTRDRLMEAKPVWLSMAHQAMDDPHKRVWLRDALEFVDTLRPILRTQTGEAYRLHESLQAAAASAGTFASTSYVFSDIIHPRTMQMEYAPMPVSTDSEGTSLCERLEKLDATLGSICREVSQTLYGTRADPDRAALFAMRQSLDHFFDILAPADEVRGSKYWTPKAAGKRSQVYRAERIQYAAHTHVDDPQRAANLAASAQQLLHLYEELNQMHIRGALDKHAARKAVASGARMLTDWADALGL